MRKRMITLHTCLAENDSCMISLVPYCHWHDLLVSGSELDMMVKAAGQAASRRQSLTLRCTTTGCGP
jgi:hypothetical protein